MPGFFFRCGEDDRADGELKSVAFRPLAFREPQCVAFHLSWLSLFWTSFGFFAPVALLAALCEDLDLTDADLVSGNLASASGAVSALLLAGVACDVAGPRFTQAGVLLLTAPVLLGFGLVTDATGFVIGRFLLGFAIAAFVGSQYWCSAMFGVGILGRVTATAAGLGYSGCWVSFLIMPVLVEDMHMGVPIFTAWRYAIMLPGIMQIVVGIMILVWGSDMPSGTMPAIYDQLGMKPTKTLRTFWTAVSNCRMWLISWLCVFSWGVDLAIQYEIVAYLTNKFCLSSYNVSVLIPLFGIFNIFSRMMGGYLSDSMAQVHGMQGRLAALWFSQSLSAVLLMFLGIACGSLLATVIILGAFSVFSIASQGETFAIVPFVSKRAHGAVCGFVSAGGVFGSALFQGAFFQNSKLDPSSDMVVIGILSLICTQTILLLKFPQWGGLLYPPEDGMLEEDYYLQEYTNSEIARGDAHTSLLFAVETRSQRSTDLALQRVVTKPRNEPCASHSIECSNRRYRGNI